jgi:hypothetical protein
MHINSVLLIAAQGFLSLSRTQVLTLTNGQPPKRYREHSLNAIEPQWISIRRGVLFKSELAYSLQEIRGGPADSTGGDSYFAYLRRHVDSQRDMERLTDADMDREMGVFGDLEYCIGVRELHAEY